MLLIRDAIVCQILYVDNNMLLAEQCNDAIWCRKYGTEN